MNIFFIYIEIREFLSNLIPMRIYTGMLSLVRLQYLYDIFLDNLVSLSDYQEEEEEELLH